MNKYIKPEIAVEKLAFNDLLIDITSRQPKDDDKDNQFSKSRNVNFAEDNDFGF